MIKQPINIDGVKTLPYDKFIAIGCSFTQFMWMTWADILALDFNCNIDTYINLAHPGCGNQYIFSQLVGMDALGELTPDTCVAICWSTTTRHDTYISPAHWTGNGDIQFNPNFSDDFILNHFDYVGYVYRDLTLMQAAKTILEKNGCDFEFFKMASIMPPELESSDAAKRNDWECILQLFQEVIDITHPSIIDVCNLDAAATQQNNPRCIAVHPRFSDTHPLPLEHLEYIERVLERELSPSTHKAVHQHQGIIVENIRDLLQDPHLDYHDQGFRDAFAARLPPQLNKHCQTFPTNLGEWFNTNGAWANGK